MKVAKKKINKAILEILALKMKYAKLGTSFISKILDEAVKKIGWNYAKLVENEICKK